MSLAIAEAWKYQGLTYPNPAVGAIVTLNNMIVSTECHKSAGFPHAEVLAIKSAYLKLCTNKDKKLTLSGINDSAQIHEFMYSNHDNLFQNCTIYSTLEPCNHYGKTPPCANLISKLGFKRAVFGSFDSGDSSKGGNITLNQHNVEVVSGVLKRECDALLEPFLDWSRGRFVFFKYAQTLNGVVAPGKISCDKSFEMVHSLRDKIDLVIVGGNTVRTDRPTLDARFVGGRAPDVMIYSRGDDFDRTIPLFAVPNRKVFVSDKLAIPDDYKFIMIEGGGEMFELSKDICSHYLIFIAPSIRSSSILSTNCIDFAYQNSFIVGTDIAIWAKKEK